MTAPQINLTFPHDWRAEILAARPLILPSRHFVYPREAEEVERGALEVMVRPGPSASTHSAELPLAGSRFQNQGPGAPKPLEPFLATCALGFRDPAAPTGIWSAPHPAEICTVSGGYAYLIDTTAPERFTMLPYRPVLSVRPAPEQDLLLFVEHRGILAWGANGLAWQADRLSDEGVTITGVEGAVLHGLGWKLLTDKEEPFALDLRTGALMAQR